MTVAYPDNTNREQNKIARRKLVLPRTAAEWFKIIIYAIVFLALIVLIVIPVFMLFYGSFRDTPPGRPGEFTLQNYDFIFTSQFASLVVNSFIIGFGSTALAVTIGLGLAVLLGRIRVPFAKTLDALVLVPAYLTPVVGAIAWIILLSPNRGWINIVLAQFGLPTFDIYGFGGIIWVMGLYYAPLAYLYIRPMLAGLDKSLEESARVLGASPRLAFRKIVIPLAIPALSAAILIIFVNAIGDFAIPGALGYRDKIEVIPTALMRLVVIFPADPNRATVLGIVLMAITIVCFAISQRIMKGRNFTTIGGRGLKAPEGASPIVRYIAFAVVMVYVILALVLPILAIAVTSFQRFPNPNLLSASYTLDNYRFVLTFPAISRSITNSAMLALGAAAAGTVLAVVIGYLVVKAKSRTSAVIDYLSGSTLAIPHTVFGLGILWFWVLMPVGVYGSRWILLIAYVAFFFPYALRSAVNSFLQIDQAMEEAGRLFGASWIRIITRIIVPIIVPGLLSGATIIIYHSFRELTGSLMLYSPGGEVMATAIWGLFIEGRFVELFALAMLNIIIVLSLVALANYLANKAQEQLH